MAQFVDGFVIPIRKQNLAAYRRLALAASKVWRDHGALEYRECAGEDIKAAGGFPRQLKLKRGKPSSSPGSCTNRGHTATASTRRS